MFISFVIPVYNSDKYLGCCLDSILNQDIMQEEFEIICINDGSTDDSLKILDKYKQKHNNVIVKNIKENKGVCNARNLGINNARGDYIWFIDSDDYIEENCLKSIYEAIKDKNYDRVIIDNLYFDDGLEKNKNDNELKMNTSWYDSVVWRNIFKREYLLNNNLIFKYPDLSYGEDALYMYEIKRFNPKTFYINQAIYYHRGRINSLGHKNSYDSMIRILKSNIIESEIMKNYYETGEEISECSDRFMIFLWGAMYSIAQLSRKDSKYYLNEMKKKKLFPYKKPSNCHITKSYQWKTNNIYEKIFDKIYTNLNTYNGYYLMRIWFLLYRLKNNRKSIR